MAKKKLYSTGVREGMNDDWEPFIQIDHQMMFFAGSETKEEAQWKRRQIEIAINRLIKKAKEQ